MVALKGGKCDSHLISDEKKGKICSKSERASTTWNTPHQNKSSPVWLGPLQPAQMHQDTLHLIYNGVQPSEPSGMPCLRQPPRGPPPAPPPERAAVRQAKHGAPCPAERPHHRNRAVHCPLKTGQHALVRGRGSRCSRARLDSLRAFSRIPSEEVDAQLCHRPHPFAPVELSRWMSIPSQSLQCGPRGETWIDPARLGTPPAPPRLVPLVSGCQGHQFFSSGILGGKMSRA